MADFQIVENLRISASYSLLKLKPTDAAIVSNAKAGQFAQVATPDNATFLRRPISICNVDSEGMLWLLVRRAGAGTEAIIEAPESGYLNLILPLGNGFTIEGKGRRRLLIGGGVGVAPLLYLGKKLKEAGVEPSFLLGARSEADLLLLDEFLKIGEVAISTEDGSKGSKGLVTANPILERDFDTYYCCGPMPMMKAVAKIARDKGTDCEVSLENVMGCGIGACLCCVEKTTEGNLCVCKEGPVFNINKLLWQD